ncbi:hypothetical protein FTO68_01040 [Methanocalculus taiwanensis]|uniref:Uncharacterized protein n=1 Tax=Methanocalculus taiwanensis TaxID=106207 RepID=A0ABD4TIC5_9EURY|nr:hypothetical protein [Methanocalculus taiwanensis]MCQ1537580.1 hypothetical protein [Methanocalculus taiwanensis]
MTVATHKIGAILLLTLAAVLVSGCTFGTTPLDEIQKHVTLANDALEELSIIGGQTSTYTLEDELFLIDQIFYEMEEIPEENEEMMARYAAYRIWTDALRSASSIIGRDYQSYTAHLKRAAQHYDSFNYIGWRQELDEAGNVITTMERNALSAAYSLDEIPDGILSTKEQTELLRTRAAIMKIYQELPVLRNELSSAIQAT